MKTPSQFTTLASLVVQSLLSFYTTGEVIRVLMVQEERVMHAPVPNEDQPISLPWWSQLCGWIWKISGFLGTAVLLSLGINVFSTWLTSSRGILPPDSPLAILLMRWPLLLSISGCLLLIALLARVMSRVSTYSTSTTLVTRSRKRMLQRLRRIYQQLTSQSLREIAWLDIGLADMPDAVQNATSLVLRLSRQGMQVLSEGISIEQVYEDAAHELLILGEPGAGKSTLLYQLARALVEQAEKDTMSPLPVLLPLNSWAVKRPALDVWIVEQLCSPLYEVPRQVSQQLVQREQILPLFDGLDEMEASARVACIHAINAYHRQHQCSLVVCCRSTEYAHAASHNLLSLQRAVMVQPLSNQQVTEVLKRAGEPLVGLHSELKKNAELRMLARSPLWLSLLLLTYRGVAVRTLSTQRKILQQQIFAAYVARMVERKGNLKKYSFHITVSWLSWLAQHMRTHNQPIFYLEALQPDWLSQKHQPFYRWSIVFICLLIVILSVEASWTMLAILFSLLLRGRVEVPLYGLLGTVPLSMSAGLAFGFFFWRRAIQPSEILTWSWREMWYRLFVGLSIGLLGGAAFLWWRRKATRISEKQLTERLHLAPGEGMRRSAKNGLLVGLTAGVLVGLILGPIQMLILGYLSELPMSLDIALVLFQGLFEGLFVGLLMGLFFGIAACVQHYMLRFWLWRIHVFPWKAVAFLEDATTRVLLRRAGGGYIFAHRLLLDYFAKGDATTDSSPLMPAHPKQSSSP